MDNDTVKRLLELNRGFYQSFAVQFSATRKRLQPGVQRILARLSSDARILDLGCGNGELWRNLRERGHQGAYFGLDFSSELLKISATPGETSQAAFIQADIASPDWDQSFQEGDFDVILAFAALHHIPSTRLRKQILDKLRKLIAPDGIFYHSEWQFLNSARLRERIQPWESVNIDVGKLEAGDYLLDWRQGGYGLRYVHHFERDELARLAQESGFKIWETFLSDGEGGNLGLYQVWKTSD